MDRFNKEEKGEEMCKVVDKPPMFLFMALLFTTTMRPKYMESCEQQAWLGLTLVPLFVPNYITTTYHAHSIPSNSSLTTSL